MAFTDEPSAGAGDRLPHIGVIAGPNLASEIADKQLTATVIASADALTRTRVQQVLGCRYFRVYASNDRHGVELGAH